MPTLVFIFNAYFIQNLFLSLSSFDCLPDTVLHTALEKVTVKNLEHTYSK